MIDDNYKIIKDSDYGYKRLDPIPSTEYLTHFYENDYFKLILQGGRAPGLRRIATGGEKAEHELKWLQATLYSDICYICEQFAHGKRVLDIGCGTGDMLAFLQEKGFDTVGIEPSSEMAAIAVSKHITICNSFNTLIESLRLSTLDKFDTITLINVLEHVPSPVEVIKTIKAMLNPGGIICVRVPNDFSEMQLAAQKIIDNKAWWIAVPDHINYFDFQSLKSLVEHLGFEVFYWLGDFPMELFLLMGDNYINDPEVGSKCHSKRINFELSFPAETRRLMYKALIEIGLGRSCLIVGKLREGRNSDVA